MPEPNQSGGRLFPSLLTGGRSNRASTQAAQGTPTSQGTTTPVATTTPSQAAINSAITAATRADNEKIRKLKSRVQFICSKLEEAEKLEQLANPRIIRWYNGNSRYIHSLPRAAQIDRFEQDLCYLCGQLIDADLFKSDEPFTHRRIRNWHTQFQSNRETRVKNAIKRRFEAEPQLANTVEGIQKVIDNVIADAEEMHPVSDYHKGWYEELVNNKASEIIGNEDTQRIREEALALLSETQQRALGLLNEVADHEAAEEAETK